MYDEVPCHDPDLPASEGRLRAMARQIGAARYIDVGWLAEMLESAEWLTSADLDRLRILVADLRAVEFGEVGDGDGP